MEFDHLETLLIGNLAYKMDICARSLLPIAKVGSGKRQTTRRWWIG